MGNKRPYKKQRERAVVVPEDVKVKILSKLNDLRDILLGEATPQMSVARQMVVWEDFIQFCNDNGANYKDKSHFMRNWSNWKRGLEAKITEKNKTGGGRGEDFTEAEELIYNINKSSTDFQNAVEVISVGLVSMTTS